MKVHAIICNKCGATIYSRAVHDFHWCPCKTVAIDGGFDYTRIIGTDFRQTKIEVKATKEELFNDWNIQIDKFGTIK